MRFVIFIILLLAVIWAGYYQAENPTPQQGDPKPSQIINLPEHLKHAVQPGVTMTNNATGPISGPLSPNASTTTTNAAAPVAPAETAPAYGITPQGNPPSANAAAVESPVAPQPVSTTPPTDVAIPAPLVDGSTLVDPFSLPATPEQAPALDSLANEVADPAAIPGLNVTPSQAPAAVPATGAANDPAAPAIEAMEKELEAPEFLKQ